MRPNVKNKTNDVTRGEAESDGTSAARKAHAPNRTARPPPPDMHLLSATLAENVDDLKGKYHRAHMKAAKAQAQVDRRRALLRRDLPPLAPEEPSFEDDEILRRREADLAARNTSLRAIAEALATAEAKLAEQKRWEKERTRTERALVYEDDAGALRAKLQDTGATVSGVSGLAPGEALLTVIEAAGATVMVGADSAPPSPTLSGVVREWVDERAYGIIALADGRTVDGRDTIMFHRKRCAIAGPVEGMPVLFAIAVKERDPSKWCAVDVIEAPTPHGNDEWVHRADGELWNWSVGVCDRPAWEPPPHWAWAVPPQYTIEGDRWGAAATCANPYAPVYTGKLPEGFAVVERPGGDY